MSEHERIADLEAEVERLKDALSVVQHSLATLPDILSGIPTIEQRLRWLEAASGTVRLMGEGMPLRWPFPWSRPNPNQ